MAYRVTVTQQEDCPGCDGSGQVAISEGEWNEWTRTYDYDAGPCPECSGTGTVAVVVDRKGDLAMTHEEKVARYAVLLKNLDLDSLLDAYSVQRQRFTENWGDEDARTQMRMIKSEVQRRINKEN